MNDPSPPQQRRPRTALGLVLPDNWKDAIDILSKTLIAGIVGLFTLLYQTQADEKKQEVAVIETILQQKRDKANQIHEAREDRRSTHKFFIDGLPTDFSSESASVKFYILNAFCGDKDTASDTVVRAGCDHLPRPTISSSERAATARQIATAPDEYLRSTDATRANIVVAAAEASDSETIGPNWFAVVGTVPLSDSVGLDRLKTTITKRLAAAKLDITVKTYRTKVSHSFALTLGDGTTRDEALRRVAEARSSGVVSDAFAQPDRQWTAITQ